MNIFEIQVKEKVLAIYDFYDYISLAERGQMRPGSKSVVTIYRLPPVTGCSRVMSGRRTTCVCPFCIFYMEWDLTVILCE